MKSFAVIAGLSGLALGTAVTSAIAPSASAPSGCSTTYSGNFELEVIKASTKKRSTSVALSLTLSDGILKDSEGRTGYIASNNQFQFDNPVQDGAIYTAGWSACSNGSLALGGSTVFYECLSGTFYNLYDTDEAAQCSPIELYMVTSSSNAVSQISDGQVTAGVATVLCQITDGQVQENTCLTTMTTSASGVVVTQISDGQIQAGTTSAGTAAKTTAAVTTATQTTVSGSASASSNGTTAVNSATLSSSKTSSTSSATAATGAAILPTIKAELFALAAGVLVFAAL